MTGDRQDVVSTDDEVEQQTAIPLPAREAMSIVDPTLGPKVFPQSATPDPAVTDPVMTTDQGIDERSPSG
jgi:hypothetical protein